MLKLGVNSNTEYNARVKMEYKHSDKLTVGFNIPLSTQSIEEPTDYVGAQNFANFRWSFDHPYTQEGRYMSWNAAPSLVGRFIDAGDATIVNYRINPQVYATFTPIKNLDISGRFTKSIFTQRRRAVFKSFRTYFYDESPGGLNIQPFQSNVDVRNWFDQTFIGNVTASYRTTIANDHTVRALVGVSHEEFLDDFARAWRNNLVFDGLSSLDIGDSEEQFNDDAQSEVSLKSVFGNLSYSFKDRYTLEGTFRRDGSSRFARGFKYDSFFSIGGAWNVTNEQFIQDLNLTALNSLKIRASWGQLGNQGSIGTYSFASTLNIGTGVLLGVPGSVAPAQVATLGSFPNLSATWEAADKTNFGIDATLFNNRLSLEANYFITETKNGFFRQDFPSIIGANPPQVNGANFKATGWIASLGWTDKINEDLNYNLRFNISDANTEVLELADSPVVSYGFNDFVEGQAIGTMYGLAFDGLIEDDADLADYYSRITGGITSLLRPGDAKYKDLDGDGILEFREYKEDANGNPTSDSGDLINLGDTERHYEYNMNIGLNWKNFDFSALLTGVGKWTVFDQTPQGYALPWIQPYEHYIDNYWLPTRTDAHYPRPFVVNGSFNQAVSVNNYRVSDAPYSRRSNAYLLLKNIQLGYTLPKSITDKINIQRLKFYVNASDVGFLINNMWDSYSPESPFNANVTPYPITVSFGLNVNL
jgi:TonB-linked SusC/RagA family outer membrane protein